MDFSRARDEGPAWEPTADKVLGLDQLADLGTTAAGSPGPAMPAEDDLQDLGDLTYAQLAQARGLDPEAMDRLADLKLPRPSRAVEAGPRPPVGASSTVPAPGSSVPALAPTVPVPLAASTTPAPPAMVAAAGSSVPPTVAAAASTVPVPAPTVPAPAPMVAAPVPTFAELPTWPPAGLVPGTSGDPVAGSAGPDRSESPTRLRWRWSRRSGG
jgi:hypothetical protein